MKKVIFLTLAAALMATLPLGFVIAQSEVLGKVDIRAVRMMQLDSGGETYTGKVGVILETLSDQEVKLAESTFTVLLQAGSGTPVRIGTGEVAEILLPAAATSEDAVNPGTREIVLDLQVGPKDSETLDRLIQLFNIIGDPRNEVKLLLTGTSKVGVRLPRGWMYQEGITVEFEFNPTIQRELIFE